MKREPSELAKNIRQHAIEKLSCFNDKDPSTLSMLESQQLIHELRVHKFELEMQIDEERRTMDELEKSRRNYFDIFYLAQDGYLTLNDNGIICKANIAASRMLGAQRNELLQKPVTSFILPEDQDIYYLSFRKFLANHKPMSCELRLQKKDSTPFWAHLSVNAVQDHMTSTDADDQCAVVYHVTFKDITERKQVEAALRKSEQENAFKAEILHMAPVIAAFHDKDLKIVWANHAYEKATGHSLQEMVGKKCHLFWGLSEPCSNCPVEAAIATGKPCEAEISSQHKNSGSDSRGGGLLLVIKSRTEVRL